MRVEKRMTSEKAIGFLENARNEIPNLSEEETKSKKFMEWKRNTETDIIYIFGTDSRNLRDLQQISYTYQSLMGEVPANDTSFQDGLDKAEVCLNSMINEIKNHWAE